MDKNSRHENQRVSERLSAAAVIDVEGREVPITEEMIQRACQALEASWRMPLGQHRDH
ncbi:MAG: PA1571 family protein [Porticoccaceae bacterium]